METETKKREKMENTNYSVPEGRYIKIHIDLEEEERKRFFMDLNRRLSKIGGIAKSQGTTE